MSHALLSIGSLLMYALADKYLVEEERIDSSAIDHLLFCIFVGRGFLNCFVFGIYCVI